MRLDDNRSLTTAQAAAAARRTRSMEELTAVTTTKKKDVDDLDDLPGFLLADEREILGDLLPPTPPAAVYRDSGQEVQRISVITNLPELLQENHTECMRRIVPKIREVVRVAEAEMQLASCGVFLQILERNLVPIQNYTQTFLQTILMCMENKDAEISKVWLDTLLDVIELLPKDVISKEILGKAVAKGQLSQPVQSRLACCKILGKVATKFEPFVIKRDILPVVLALCQDVDYEVRACMSRLLEPVARGLGLEETKTAILPELVELTNDEHSFVRLAGLDTVVSILSLLDNDAQTSTVIPLVCKYCQQSLSKQDETLSAISKHFGQLCLGLSDNLTEDQKKYFVNFFRKLCQTGSSRKNDSQSMAAKQARSLPLNQMLSFFDFKDNEQEDELDKCRQNAAANIPAMVSFMSPKAFRSELATTFSQLCLDANYHVRQTVASGFLQVVTLLGSSAHFVVQDLIKLLNDDSIEVLRNGFISQLPETLDLVFGSFSVPANAETKFNEVLSALLGCEAVVFASTNWRLQEEFTQMLASLPRCFSSDIVNQKIVPLVFRKLHLARALPVRRAAARTLLFLMRSNRRVEQRKEICQRLVQELAYSRSFFERSLYIDMCANALEIYSRSFFKDNFLEALLGLYDDSVPNIRLRLCRLLPQVKRSLRQPSDKALGVLLENSVRKLRSNEKDRDVIAAWEKATSVMDREPIQMDCYTSSRFKHEDDVADEKKLAEENMLLEIEDQEKRDEEQKQKEKTKEKRDSKLPQPRKALPKPTAPVGTGTGAPLSTQPPSGNKDGRKISVTTPNKVSSAIKRNSMPNNIAAPPNSASQLSTSPAPTSIATVSRKNSTSSLSGNSGTNSSSSPAKTRASATSVTPDGRKPLPVSNQRRTSLGSPFPPEKKK